MASRSITLRTVCLALIVLLAACHPITPQAEPLQTDTPPLQTPEATRTQVAEPTASPTPAIELVQADAPRVAIPEASEAQVAELVAGNNAFAFDLYHAIAAAQQGNLIYSPYSISLLFSMVYAGAQDETEAQIAQVLHFAPQDVQHPAFNAITQQLSNLSGENEAFFQLQLANTVWGQRGYPFKEPYLETLSRHYGAGVYVVDFQSAAEEAREAINAWVAKETQGRIDEIASPGSITPATRLVLANAIYFKATWYYRFLEATTDGPFTLLDGSQVTVPLMHQRARFGYMEGQGYQAVRLPYGGQAADMWIILPEQGRFSDVEARLDADVLREAGTLARGYDVTLTMPRFGFETTLQLSDLLMGMHMADAFCPAMDYGGMVQGGGLCVSTAVHRATITVDEEGTEAAAATMAIIMESWVPAAEVTIDRPFVFAIVARESGAILFLGRVLDPSVG